MRLLLDTNILIPLEDSQYPLAESLTNLVRLAHKHNHQLIYHPASEDDINRDPNSTRREQTLSRLRLYTRLDTRTPCPWNSTDTRENDAADNEILYALHCDAAHALITEDRGIHDNARRRGLVDRVFTIQTAEDWLLRLHEEHRVPLPNIEEVDLYSLTPHLNDPFFDSLREGYPGFDTWFRNKARDGQRAWIAREQNQALGAACIYSQQRNEQITEEGLTLNGTALKLCTFKVGEGARGKKIGELFLKAAFRYATINRLENVFIHGDRDQHHFLFEMLIDFGFSHVGTHPGTNSSDSVYLKRHPSTPPEPTTEPFEYVRSFFPHFRHDADIKKFIVPIQPVYHDILFPDYDSQPVKQFQLLQPRNTAGNAIKLAYLCHAQTRFMTPGDIVLFYRSIDDQAVTSIGVVESYETLEDAAIVASRVKRRTVYSMKEIETMAARPTRVMLFRHVKHFTIPLNRDWLVTQQVTRGTPQSITKISDISFHKILTHGE